LVTGTVNRWADFAQLGGGNDVFVKYPKVWPQFFAGSDLDGTKLKPFWVRGSDGRYVDLSSILFPSLTAPARGIAIGDVTGDGYPDMVFADLWSDSVYVKNQTTGNGFLGLHLLLPLATSDSAAKLAAVMRVHNGHPTWREGTPAIGAFVEAELPDGRRPIRQVDGGNGHSGQRSPELRFGLGRNPPSAIPVHITWRDVSGALHHDKLILAPGYHTIVLGAHG
jgi:hypothetical protein